MNFLNFKKAVDNTYHYCNIYCTQVIIFVLCHSHALPRLTTYTSKIYNGVTIVIKILVTVRTYLNIMSIHFSTKA